MLRLATREDEDRIFELLKHFFSQTEYAKEDLDEEKVKGLIQTCIDPRVVENVVLLWDVEGKVQGLVAGQWTEMVFNRERVATELVWWVEPEYRKTEASAKLLSAFEAWADWNGCARVQMYALNNDYATILHRYYQRWGYRLAELSYVKDIR